MDVNPTKLLDQRVTLFPISTQISGIESRQISIGGVGLQELAEQFGTPLYLYDRVTLDASVIEYRQALGSWYPGPAGITYAGKAFLCTAIAQWAGGQNLWVDCTGAGELAIARAANLPRSQVLVHGVSKSETDLNTAIAQAGTIVVDNLEELKHLRTLLQDHPDKCPDLWLRLRPGLAVSTHSYRQTGQEDSKFGMHPAEILEAVQLCLIEGLPLKGLHFHQGSHFHDPAPIGPALEIALDVVCEARSECEWTPEAICPGGGWGVPYHEDDLPHLSVESYIQFISERLVEGCASREIPLPRLHLEPGRSLVARAGVAVYRVEAVKHTSSRRWLLLDGGLADNPRPALYRARYSALPVSRLERPFVGPAWLAGPFCESGDILIEALEMPEVQTGEYIAIPVSGAYHLSMGSNYNGARKPAVVWLDGGRATLIQRRETLEDLVRRDMPLPEPNRA